MTIFAILPPAPSAALDASIQKAYPNDSLRLAPNQWLVSAKGTAIDVSREIGVVPPEGTPPVAAAIIFAIASYYGRAPTPVWDWIKAKLEAKVDG